MWFNSFYFFLPLARAAWLARDGSAAKSPHATENSEEPLQNLKGRFLNNLKNSPVYPALSSATENSQVHATSCGSIPLSLPIFT
jgi:hypothetical protein